MFWSRKPILIVTLNLDHNDPAFSLKYSMITENLMNVLSKDYYVITINDPEQRKQAEFELLEVRDDSPKSMAELRKEIDAKLNKALL